MARDLAGKHFGNFEVGGLIGAGGMGAVYEGVHRVLGHRVAIKLVHLGYGTEGLSDDALRRFTAEAKALTEIGDCPYVVRLHDFGQTDDGDPYYVMEYVEGHDLAAELERRGPLSAAQAAPYLQQICDGLAAAHAAGIIHRDLKPANILVLDDTRLRLKLLDFGIAKRLHTLHQPTHDMVGTPLYAAPEQILDQAVSPATDIYAVGVLLYQLLSGKLPFDVSPRAHPLAAFRVPLDRDPLPLAERAPGVPEAVAELIHRCLARDPTARPASAAELAEAYARALTAEGPAAAPAPALSPSARVIASPSASLECDATLDPLGSTVPSLEGVVAPTLVTRPPATVVAGESKVADTVVDDPVFDARSDAVPDASSPALRRTFLALAGSIVVAFAAIVASSDLCQRAAANVFGITGAAAQLAGWSVFGGLVTGLAALGWALDRWLRQLPSSGRWLFGDGLLVAGGAALAAFVHQYARYTAHLEFLTGDARSLA